MRKITEIYIHHSASGTSTTAAQIKQWHEANPRIGRIGYNRIIHGDGEVLDGCPVQRMGAHASGSNRNSVGICVVGDNTREDRKWTEAQGDSLVREILYWKSRYPKAKVRGHRDAPGARTECPGLDIKEWCRARGINV